MESPVLLLLECWGLMNTRLKGFDRFSWTPVVCLLKVIPLLGGTSTSQDGLLETSWSHLVGVSDQTQVDLEEGSVTSDSSAFQMVHRCREAQTAIGEAVRLQSTLRKRSRRLARCLQTQQEVQRRVPDEESSNE